MAALFSFAFVATVLLALEWVMGLYSDSPEIIKRGSEYLWIIGWAYLFQVPVVFVLVLMKLDEPLKALLCLIRLKSGRWIKQVTREEL